MVIAMDEGDGDERFCRVCNEVDTRCDCLFCPECDELVARELCWHRARIEPAVSFCSTACLLAFGQRQLERDRDRLLALHITLDGTIRVGAVG